MKSTTLVFAALLALPAFGASPLPHYAAFPDNFQSNDAREVVENFGRDEFPAQGDALPRQLEGKHYAAEMHAEPPLELDEEPTWSRLKTWFVGNGWKIVRDTPGPHVLRLKTAERDAWLKLDIFNSEDVRVSLIEIAQQAVKLTLPPPAPKPESVAPHSDFPYLGHYPGSQLKGSETDAGPMFITAGNEQEPQLAGSSSIVKSYSVPELTSVHQVLTVYRDALNAAGWNIVAMAEPSDGVLVAHWAKNGRDIWASLHVNGDDITLRVADAGSSADLAKQLERACHVPLYGLHFDFNKATLRPDSDSTLQQVRELLNANPSLNVELQGHTDNVGGDDSNQRLSDARAAAVRDWLVSHGVAATRLTSRGYGKTQPVAPNDTDLGRAKNRRVEIARAGCK